MKLAIASALLASAIAVSRVSAQTQDTAARVKRDTLHSLSDTARNRPVVRECDAPQAGWIFCDDFESDRSSSYFERTHPSTLTRVVAAGILGSSGMRAHFDSGSVDAGSLKLAFGRTPVPYLHPVDSGTVAYRDIYWRLYFRTDSGWTGGGGDKMTRAQSLTSAGWIQAMGAPVWSTGGGGADPDYLAIDPYSGTDASGTIVANAYNDFDHLRWLGAAHSSTRMFDPMHAGKWYCIEAHARLNDSGKSNGIFELWIDDRLEAQRAGLSWLGTYTGYGINTLFLENYWNSGSPVSQNRYFDNLVISTARIGCGSAGTG